MVYASIHVRPSEFNHFLIRHPYPAHICLYCTVHSLNVVIIVLRHIRDDRTICRREVPDYLLDRRIRILHKLTYNGRIARANHVQVSVRYYVPCTDENNFAFQLRGQYRIVSGICRKVESDVTNSITIDEAVIPLTDVIEITAADENIFKKDE